MPNYTIIPQEEIERFIKEYDKTHPFPSCGLCKNKQITVLKYRKYKGEIRINECIEGCKLNLDFDNVSLRRAVKCAGYKHGDNEYTIKKKEC